MVQLPFQPHNLYIDAVVILDAKSVSAKLLVYNKANRAVAILCNHQRAVPKNFGKQMETLQLKVSS